MKTDAPEEVDRYLSKRKGDAHRTLRKLRAAIKSAAPRATEGMSYQIPTFFLKGALVSYAAFKNHCSFFPLSSSLLQKFKKDLEGFETSKGTIRFPLNKPLHSSLVRRIVKARIRQNELKQKLREKKNST